MKTKYTSQIAQKLQRKAILLAIIALALCASPGSRGDQECNGYLATNWTGMVDNNWFNQSNWDNGVPGCASPTGINNGGTAQINTPTPTASACATVLGEYSGQSGNLSVDHGTLDTCSVLEVGYGGTGVLKITNGGLVTTTFDADIGGVAGSYGAATVDGSNPDGRKSTWTVTGSPPDGGVYVGGSNSSAGGTGLLTVTNGGTVNAASVYVYPSGTLTGNSTVSTPNGGTTTVAGTLSPNWTLTIEGDLIFTNVATTPLMQCTVTPGNSGNDAHVTGAATLTGKLSVTMTGTFTCGTTYTLLHADGGLGNTKFQSRFN